LPPRRGTQRLAEEATAAPEAAAANVARRSEASVESPGWAWPAPLRSDELVCGGVVVVERETVVVDVVAVAVAGSVVVEVLDRVVPGLGTEFTTYVLIGCEVMTGAENAALVRFAVSPDCRPLIAAFAADSVVVVMVMLMARPAASSRRPVLTTEMFTWVAWTEAALATATLKFCCLVSLNSAKVVLGSVRDILTR
jgi:hypothetical protein